MRELADVILQRHAVLQAHRHARAEGIHQATDGRTFLGHRDEQLARPTIFEQAHRDVALVTRDAELVGDRLPRVGEPLAVRLTSQRRLFVLLLVGFGAGVQRLAFFRAVAINGDRLEAQLPTIDVGLRDLFGGRRARHVDRFGNRTGEKRLSRGHHRHVGLPRNTAGAVARLERTIEHVQVLGLQVGGSFDRIFTVDVAEDRFDGRLVVAQGLERERHGLIDDLEHAATGQLLVLHQRDIGFDAGRVAIHHEADRAGRSKHGRLGIAEAVGLARGEHVVP